MNEETRNLMEEKLVEMMNELDTLKEGSDEHKNLTSDICQLATKLTEATASEMDAFDKQEKRRIDEQKNKSMTEIEKEKAGFDWRKALTETLKVVLPSVISIYAYNEFQKRILKFEETGRLTTTASRELHLPRFMK